MRWNKRWENVRASNDKVRWFCACGFTLSLFSCGYQCKQFIPSSKHSKVKRLFMASNFVSIFFFFGYLLGQWIRNMRQKQWISANWLHIVRTARPLLSNGRQELCSNDWISLNCILFFSEWLVHNVSCSKRVQGRCWPVENLIKLKIGKRRLSSKANNNGRKKKIFCPLRSRANLKCNWWSLLGNEPIVGTSIALSLFFIKILSLCFSIGRYNFQLKDILFYCVKASYDSVACVFHRGHVLLFLFFISFLFFWFASIFFQGKRLCVTVTIDST